MELNIKNNIKAFYSINHLLMGYNLLFNNFDSNYNTTSIVNNIYIYYYYYKI